MSTKAIVALFLLCSCLALVVGIGLGILASGRIQLPSPQQALSGVTSIGGTNYDEWTHEELFQYLSKSGTVTDRIAGRGLYLTMYFQKDDKHRSMEGTKMYMDAGGREAVNTLLVTKYPSPTQARDVAGASGGQAVAWHCFVISGDQKLLAQVKRVLP